MDIHGRAPTDALGQDIGMNWSAWSGLLGFVRAVNATDNLGLDTEGWGFNDGKGLGVQADCDALADALERVLPETTATEIWGEAPPLEPCPFCREFRSEPRDRIVLVKRFVRFLRSCGGFEIW
jgi:hypothetical protein